MIVRSILALSPSQMISSLKLVGKLAIVAHGLSGSLKTLRVVDIAALQALGLIGIKVGGPESVEALIEAANKHGSLEFLSMHLSLSVHFVSFNIII